MHLIFRNRSGRAYSKDTLSHDFRHIRAIVFGPAETRTLADFRRSGAVEAMRGGASAERIGNKSEGETKITMALNPSDPAGRKAVNGKSYRPRAHKSVDGLTERCDVFSRLKHCYTCLTKRDALPGSSRRSAPAQ